MASYAKMPEQAFHARSISVPSRPHPTALRVEEELRNLRSCAPPSSCQTNFSMTTGAMCGQLRDLGDLYSRIQDLLRLRSIQQGHFSPHQKKLLEEEIDSSVWLLDLCATTKDTLGTLKEHVQDLLSALRRRADSASGGKLHAYVCSRKEAEKVIKSCYKEYSKLRVGKKAVPPINEDGDLPGAIRMLNEAREITISLLCSVLSFVSMPKPKEKASGWSFVSKAMQKRKVACEENSVEMEPIDIVSVLASNKDVINGGGLLTLRNQLEAFEVNVGDLENEVECLFRGLIQSRVSLLNILSL